MPRPPSKEPKQTTVSVRVSYAEQERLERRAEAGGHPSVSDFIRACCLAGPVHRLPQAARRAAVEVGAVKLAAVSEPRPSDQAAARLAEQIRRAGVNLNQIAHHLNEGQGYTVNMERELKTLLAEVRHVVRQARAP